MAAQALQHVTNAAYASWDPKKHPVCPPWPGAKGPEGDRFVKDFEQGIAKIELKDNAQPSDLDETLQGFDVGGSQTPPGAGGPVAHPGVNGGTAGQQRLYDASVKLRTKRNKLLFVYIKDHCLDASIKQTLINESNNDGYAAWQIVKREASEPITPLELEARYALIPFRDTALNV